MSKNIINVNIGGLSSITTITLPESGASSPGEIVIFGPTANELAGSGIYVDSQKNVAAVGSVAFDANSSNPSGANAVWMGTDSKLYLGAEAIGPITLAPIGAVPNANGATLAAGVLNLQPASDTLGGVLTAGAQEIGGDKTFTEDIYAEKTIDIAQTVDATIGVISMGGNPYIHSYGNFTNTFMGANSCIGNVPAPSSENTAFGNSSLTNIIYPAQANTALGDACLFNLTTGGSNTAVGCSILTFCTTGDSNTGLGRGTLVNVTTGSDNIGIGHNVGNGVETASNTINIGSHGSDTSGEINIGTSGTHTKTSIAGIAGVAPGGTPQAVIVNPATGQLGSQAIPTNLRSAVTNFTLTVNSGATVSSLSVRGVTQATIPITFWRMGDIVTALLPQFVVNLSSGSPTIMTLSASAPASYRPTNAQRMPIVLSVSSSATNGLLNINTDGSFQIAAVPAITLVTGSGTSSDQSFTWAIL